MAETTVWLALRPRWRPMRPYDTEPVLDGFDVEQVTKNPPRDSQGPFIKLRLIVPDSVFAPLRPAVTIEVPEHLVAEPRVEVELPDLPDIVDIEGEAGDA
jgi:hypothetical protein